MVMKYGQAQMLRIFRVLLAAIVSSTFAATVTAAATYPARPIRLIVPFAQGRRTGSWREAWFWGGDGARPPGLWHRVLRRLAGATFALTCLDPGTVAAQQYPTRPIRLIVPFAPGGGTDMVARVIAPKMSERLGTTVIVDNRGGAGAIIGTALAAKSTPDGYTLLVCDTAHTIQPVLQKLEYDPIRSFSLIASLVTGDSMLAASANVPARTLQEFIALAKQKPGQLVAGTAGAGSSGHMALELFKVMAGIDIIMAHYKGAGAATIDLLGGTIQISNITIQAGVPHIKAGRIRALGVGGLKRSALLPDVPTVDESGLTGYLSTGWRGLMGPAGMPAPVSARLTREIKAILTSDEVRTHFLNNAMEIDFRDPQQFAVFIGDEIKRWSGVVRKANISLETKK